MQYIIRELNARRSCVLPAGTVAFLGVLCDPVPDILAVGLNMICDCRSV